MNGQRILLALLLAVGVATELDLAWKHDGWRLAGCGLVLALIWVVRDDLTRRV